MKNVIGVKFKKAGKIYYFDSDGIDISIGTGVIVETARGIEFGNVVEANKEMNESQLPATLKKIIRIATEEDNKCLQKNIEKTKKAFDTCSSKIIEHKLKMKLVDVEHTFDGNKILFYFTADGRIDFRELVKDLAAIFKTRIELRQIGVRDQAKTIGGIGVCGRELCCKCCLREFETVSINMAKRQCLSLNPSKISGSCGRLMCCLKYEQAVYERLMTEIPRVGALVSTNEGQGVVVEVYLIKESIKVRLKVEGKEDNIKIFKAEDVKVIEDIAADVDSNNTEEELDLQEFKHLEE